MTQLRLKLYQPMAQGFLEASAVASVRLLADATGKVVEDWWASEMPIDVAGGEGQTGKYAVFDLPGGGYYGVDITRPRGLDISAEFFVEEGKVRTETITMEGSPHEYLGWQQFAGIVRAEPYQREEVRGPGALPSDDPRRDALIEIGQSRIDALYDKAKDSNPEVSGAKLTSDFSDWDRVGKREHLDDWYRVLPLDWPVARDPEFVAWFPKMPDSNEGMMLVEHLRKKSPPYNNFEVKFPRWVGFEIDGQIDLASVPWAWWGDFRDQSEEIRFLYDLIRPSSVDRETPGHLTISVQDRRWFGLLEFLASGRLHQAGDMLNTVMKHGDPEAALYGKGKGPLVAVAGGIILITRAESAEQQMWDDWLDNLSKWFPGIPDGAILLGCRRVEQAKNLDELGKAFSHMTTGVKRGIPFFSATIRMLSMALAQISDDIPEAKALRREIAPITTRVDPNQPFTVIRL